MSREGPYLPHEGEGLEWNKTNVIYKTIKEQGKNMGEYFITLVEDPSVQFSHSVESDSFRPHGL